LVLEPVDYVRVNSAGESAASDTNLYPKRARSTRCEVRGPRSED
jgi:hypothetical protein